MIFLYQKRVDNKKLKWSKGATCSQTNAWFLESAGVINLELLVVKC